MTWFKVPDTFDDDPRMFDAPDCAVSLWTRAGVWCSRNLTDGRIPAGLPARKCDDPERAVAELVRRGVWEPTDDGWQFVAWTEDQPSRAEVLEKRRKEADRKAAMRAALAEKRRNGRSARPTGTPRGTPARTPVGSPARSPALPDPGSLPSSGTPAAAAGGGAPAAVPAVHVPTSSPEARAEALRVVAARSSGGRRSKRVSGARPLVASVRDEVTSGASGGSSGPSAGSPARPDPRAEQDRLAELDAVQAADAAPDERVPPSSDACRPRADLREQETA